MNFKLLKVVKVVIVTIAIVLLASFSFACAGKIATTETTAAAGTAAAGETTAAAGTAAATTAEVVAEDNLKFLMAIYGTTGNPFWKKVRMGAEEMAKQLGVQLDIQYAEDDPERENNIIETAINNKVNGIGFIINIDAAYDDVVQKGLDAGIPMVCYNIDDSKGADGTNPRMAFIGQDFEPAGLILGKALIEKGGLKAGDFVACATEHPSATYSAQRFAGLKQAFDPAGIDAELFDCGAISSEDSLTNITQYLIAHPETDAVVGIGTMGTDMGAQAIKDAGMDIPNAGFDITANAMNAIIDGDMIGVVDQQPYLQGSLTIYFLWAYNMYGLYPCNVDTGTLSIVDKTMAEKILPLSETVR
jgi:simple sugar transport system substrate-binding protein